MIIKWECWSFNKRLRHTSTVAVKELKTDLGKLREDLPRTYVLKEDYRRDIYEIKDMLGKIFDKLDSKVDK